MKISFISLLPDDEVMREVLELYLSAFPSDECREVGAFMHVLRTDGRFGVMAFVDFESNRFYGFLSYWDFGSFSYIEHLAVVESCRGMGMGSGALRKFIDQVSSKIILEVEPPVDYLTQRRIAFYESLGFELHNNFPYIQPPYSSGRKAVELKLMTHGQFTLQQVADAADIITGEVYKKYSSLSEGVNYM